MIVVDASVAVKWFVNEPGSDAAADLLSTELDLVAPSLIRVEVTAGILRHFRHGNLSEHRAREACRQWHDCLASEAIDTVSNAEIFDDAKELVYQIRHAFQDCLYLAVARKLDARIVTADETFYKRAHAEFPLIQFLPGCRAN